MTMIRDPDQATREGVFGGELPTVFNDSKKAPRVVALIVGADGQPIGFGGGGASDPGAARELTLRELRDLAAGAGLKVKPSEVVQAEPGYALIEDQQADAPLPDVPAWANRALLRVTHGTLWLGYGDSQDSPGIPVGSSVELTGMELQVVQCRTSDGGIVRVDYSRVG